MRRIRTPLCGAFQGISEKRSGIIDESYKSGKPFIITTNLSLEELHNPADLEHGRIYDRIIERCVPVAFSGKNYRTGKGMANIYDGAFRTILNDCRKLIIPVINEIFGKHIQGKKKYVIITPGGTVQYDVPIMKVQKYSLDDIFEKRLLMLIPFYIFSHEKRFPEYNSNGQKLAELKAEYQEILERLDELEQQEVIGVFDKRTIIELSNDVIKEITQKYENVQKGVGDIMGGALIETEARTLLNQAIKQGKTQGISETKKQTALRMLKMGKLTNEEIAECSELSVAEVEQLAGLQTV